MNGIVLGETANRCWQDYKKFFECCFRDEYGALLKDRVEAVMSNLRSGLMDLLPGPDQHLFEARNNTDQLVGTAMCKTAGDVTYVWGFYVHPHFQRQGIGKRLMAQICKESARVIEVQVIAGSTKPMAFYKKLGFTEFEIQDDELFPSVPMKMSIMRVQRSICESQLSHIVTS